VPRRHFQKCGGTLGWIRWGNKNYWRGWRVVFEVPDEFFPRRLKRTVFGAGMLASSPVRGLRPMPVFRGFTMNTPKLDANRCDARVQWPFLRGLKDSLRLDYALVRHDDRLA